MYKTFKLLTRLFPPSPRPRTHTDQSESGRLYMWGDNTEGQLGLGQEGSSSTPKEVDVGQPVAWVSCGYYHSALVTGEPAHFANANANAIALGNLVIEVKQLVF